MPCVNTLAPREREGEHVVPPTPISRAHQAKQAHFNHLGLVHGQRPRQPERQLDTSRHLPAQKNATRTDLYTKLEKTDEGAPIGRVAARSPPRLGGARRGPPWCPTECVPTKTVDDKALAFNTAQDTMEGTDLSPRLTLHSSSRMTVVTLPSPSIVSNSTCVEDNARQSEPSAPKRRSRRANNAREASHQHCLTNAKKADLGYF